MRLPFTQAEFLKLQKHNREQLRMLAPQVLQPRKGWHGPLQHPGILPVIFLRLADQLKVLASIERKPDQRDWLHVSFSYEYQLCRIIKPSRKSGIYSSRRTRL